MITTLALASTIANPAGAPGRVVVLADRDVRGERIRAMLEPDIAVEIVALDEVRGPVDAEIIIVAASLRELETIAVLRHALATAQASARIFTIDGNERSLVVQAYALGATDVVFTPFSGRVLRARLPRGGKAQKTRAAVIGECGRALERVFAGVAGGGTPDLDQARAVTDQIIGAVASIGLTGWLDDVRRHHEGTFQHCLLVAGIAVDFGMSIKVTGTDLLNLGLAATLHDIGKAGIARYILDKPGALTDEELANIERHPVLGYESVKVLDGLPVEVRDAVRDHHEMLDGSGYPHALKGGAIGDLTRIVTIADVFAALIERRAYAPPMPRADAFRMLGEMAGRLEQPLVAAFGATALRR